MLPLDPMLLCHAKTRAGAPCGHHPMHGQRVCHMHGGKSPQAKAKAEERLRALEHPAISALADLINHADSDATRLSASRYLLELLGHKATVQVQSETEVTVRVIHEDQPIVVVERGYKLGDSNGSAG